MIVSAREGYRHWASTYDASPNPMVSLIERNLNLGETRGKVIVDVGCGTGQRVRKLSAIGIDLSFEMLERGSGNVAQADARRLPIADKSADLVLCTLALGYISPVREVAAEWVRIARPGATIIAADVHPQAIAAGWKRSFRDGATLYELETHAYSFDELSVEGLVLEDARDLYFEEPESAIYERAGKSALFERARQVPGAWVRRWTRP